VLDNLRYSLLSVDSLKEVVAATGSITLQIVFHYYFPEEESDIGKLIEQLFLQSYECYQKGTGKKSGFFGKVEKNWAVLQRRMDLVVGKVRKCLNVKEFALLLAKS
jgi:hypothetical protein